MTRLYACISSRQGRAGRGHRAVRHERDGPPRDGWEQQRRHHRRHPRPSSSPSGVTWPRSWPPTWPSGTTLHCRSAWGAAGPLDGRGPGGARRSWAPALDRRGDRAQDDGGSPVDPRPSDGRFGPGI